MPFDTSVITKLYPLEAASRGVRMRWESSAPNGTIFQVYVGRKLMYANRARTCVVPAAVGGARYQVGAVGATEKDVDFSGSLDLAPENRALLEWTGGKWLGEDWAGFRVYASTAPGGAVDFTKPVAEIPTGIGEIVEGWGMGKWGSAPWGYAPAAYSWTSGPLRNGVWNFAVVSFDTAGNESASPATWSVEVVAPPLPVARGPNQSRLNYEYDDDTNQVTLTWLASPG